MSGEINRVRRVNLRYGRYHCLLRHRYAVEASSAGKFVEACSAGGCAEARTTAAALSDRYAAEYADRRCYSCLAAGPSPVSDLRSDL